MADFRPAYPHGRFDEVFPDLFFLRGSLRLGPGVSITRNMVVVRQGDELTLVNSVRLSDDGETELERLGKVRHLVRLGFFHGADDAYYLHRYKPTFWAPKGQQHAAGVTPEHELRDRQTPIERSSAFSFENGKQAEALLLIDRDGGVIVPCDSYQNWTSFEGCSSIGKVMMRAMRFGPTIIGGPWVRRMGPSVRKDFDALVERDFRHLLPAHGEPLVETAKDGLKTAIRHRFSGPSSLVL